MLDIRSQMPDGMLSSREELSRLKDMPTGCPENYSTGYEHIVNPITKKQWLESISEIKEAMMDYDGCYEPYG